MICIKLPMTAFEHVVSLQFYDLVVKMLKVSSFNSEKAIIYTPPDINETNKDIPDNSFGITFPKSNSSGVNPVPES